MRYGIGTAAAWLLLVLGAANAAAQSTAATDRVHHGVGAGEVTATTAVVWARCNHAGVLTVRAKAESAKGETMGRVAVTRARDFTGRAMEWLVRRLGQPVTGEYWHRVLHPHATGSSLDVFRMMQCVFPTGPRTCRYRCILFTLRGVRRSVFAWACYRFLRSISTMVAYKVFREDASIYRGVQRGLEVSPHPGVIGTREERIHVV